MTKNILFGWTLHSVRFHTRLKNTSPSVQCVFMFGVSPIEMIVEIALSLLAVMCNFHNHFCPAELLPKKRVNFIKGDCEYP